MINRAIILDSGLLGASAIIALFFAVVCNVPNLIFWSIVSFVRSLIWYASI